MGEIFGFFLLWGRTRGGQDFFPELARRSPAWVYGGAEDREEKLQLEGVQEGAAPPHAERKGRRTGDPLMASRQPRMGSSLPAACHPSKTFGCEPQSLGVGILEPISRDKKNLSSRSGWFFTGL